ncbi:MAG: polysaccharide pyruvyl transferase CsaB, partial [Rubrobacteridae bacterium]|nr:polysaccharide pyruvyl transferase CsaB [Rubrobacteridae bacterium]
MITSLQAEIPKIQITVASNDPQQTRELYGIESIHRSVRSIRNALKKSDIFISGGGGLLQDVTSVRSLAFYCLLLVMARQMRVPVMIYAQGIGPLKRRPSKFLVRLSVSGCNVISVRDDRSKRLLEKIGVRREIHVTADPTLLLKPSQISVLKGFQGPLIGYALRAWPGLDYDSMARIADEVNGNFGGTAILIPFHFKRDEYVAEQIASRMKTSSVVLNATFLPSDVLGAIRELDALIAMRLHATIFGAIHGVPIIPISYDPKVSEFAKSINVKEALYVDSLKSGSIIERLKKMIGENDKVENSRIQNSGIDELRLRARQNASLAKQLLKERQVVGIRFDALEMDEAADVIDSFIKKRKPRLVVTLNAEMIVMARSDERFRSILMKADLLIPDSIGIVWAGKLRARVPGIDMVEELAKRAANRGYKIFMVGSKEGVAKKAAATLIKRYPGLRIVGARSGYFSQEQEKRLVDEIKETKPDILLVGFGMGKQEKWIVDHLRLLDVPVSLGVGGSFDVIAGETRRAPKWI